MTNIQSKVWLGSGSGDCVHVCGWCWVWPQSPVACLRMMEKKRTPICSSKQSTRSHHTQVQSVVGGGAGGWKTPFFLLFLFIGACMALIYRWYEKLRKSHIL